MFDRFHLFNCDILQSFRGSPEAEIAYSFCVDVPVLVSLGDSRVIIHFAASNRPAPALWQTCDGEEGGRVSLIRFTSDQSYQVLDSILPFYNPPLPQPSSPRKFHTLAYRS